MTPFGAKCGGVLHEIRMWVESEGTIGGRCDEKRIFADQRYDVGSRRSY